MQEEEDEETREEEGRGRGKKQHGREKKYRKRWDIAEVMPRSGYLEELHANTSISQ